jgi:hypothetical protein
MNPRTPSCRLDAGELRSCGAVGGGWRADESRANRQIEPGYVITAERNAREETR